MGGKPRPESAFDMFERSHRRILETADELCAALENGGTRKEISDLLAFFEHQGLRHEVDEEQSLFPRLEQAVPHTLLKGLTLEHRQHERLCRELRTGLEATTNAADAGPLLLDLARTLRRSYKNHVEREEQLLLPAAKQALGPADDRAVWAEMQSRRGR